MGYRIQRSGGIFNFQKSILVRVFCITDRTDDSSGTDNQYVQEPNCGALHAVKQEAAHRQYRGSTIVVQYCPYTELGVARHQRNTNSTLGVVRRETVINVWRGDSSAETCEPLRYIVYQSYRTRGHTRMSHPLHISE